MMSKNWDTIMYVRVEKKKRTLRDVVLKLMTA